MSNEEDPAGHCTPLPQEEHIFYIDMKCPFLSVVAMNTSFVRLEVRNSKYFPFSGLLLTKTTYLLENL
jgi:hypothetical protein